MTLSTTVRNAMADAITSVLGSSCKLKIFNSGNTLLATIVMTFGSASGGAITVDPASVNAAASGTADHAEMHTSGDVAHITGLTVGTSGAQVNLTTLSITSGQPVDLTGVTLTMPAS